MSELVSAYPTAGGIYYWASKLGGAKWGWFTGWFNWVGLVGVVASVDYGCAQFLNATLSLYGLNLGFANWGDTAHIMSETFLLFVVILFIHALINIFSSPLVALFNNISVFWHVAGVAAIVLVLAFVPDHHQSVRFVFGHTINNSGFGHGMFWWYVLPLGFLLTMYTQTGYDASAHISEETHGAAKAAAQGVWRSVFWSGVGGWIVLLAITFAATDVTGINKGFGSSLAVFSTALSPGWDKLVVIIATVGQLFCGMACVTSCSRMTYAFSRDRAIPGWRLWTRLNHHRVPAYAVIFACVCALVMTLPALWGDQNGVAYAFLAVVSICVIGLYIAYVIPVYLRWRMGDAFTPGPWTLGRKYRWVNPAAIIWVAICVVIFILPFSPAAVPGRKEFDWRYVNYAPVTVGGLLLIVGVWWVVRARHTFKGPVRTVEFDDGAGVT
jgi:amino acid transporter